MTARPSTISQPRQLLVEGRDAEAFFYPFLENIGLTDIQIHDYKGGKELEGFLEALVRSSEYRLARVTSLGIVRDAETDPEAAFRSTCSVLRKALLPVPRKVATPTESDPRISVFILPDADSAGMLETLLLRAVVGDPAFGCIDSYLDCVTLLTGKHPMPKDKARFLTFLASRPDIKPLTGYAARAGYLNFGSEAYDRLKQYLNAF